MIKTIRGSNKAFVTDSFSHDSHIRIISDAFEAYRKLCNSGNLFFKLLAFNSEQDIDKTTLFVDAVL
jgi:hypothetical protein